MITVSCVDCLPTTLTVLQCNHKLASLGGNSNCYCVCATLHSKNKLDHRVVTRGYYICKKFLMYRGVTSFKDAYQWLPYLQDQIVGGVGSFLSGCLMQLANKQYITTDSSGCLQSGERESPKKKHHIFDLLTVVLRVISWVWAPVALCMLSK